MELQHTGIGNIFLLLIPLSKCQLKYDSILIKIKYMSVTTGITIETSIH